MTSVELFMAGFWILISCVILVDLICLIAALIMFYFLAKEHFIK